MNRRNARFIKAGLPLFSLVFGGAYGLHYFQQVRYDFRKIRQLDDNLSNLKTDLSTSGLKVRENVTVDTVYKEVANIDTDNWENIRGPRETEDNTDYLNIKSQQQQQNRKQREQKFQELKE